MLHGEGKQNHHHNHHHHDPGGVGIGVGIGKTNFNIGYLSVVTEDIYFVMKLYSLWANVPKDGHRSKVNKSPVESSSWRMAENVGTTFMAYFDKMSILFYVCVCKSS